MHGASMLRDGVVMLGVGMVFVLLFRRLGLGATLGFLVAGGSEEHTSELQSH